MSIKKIRAALEITLNSVAGIIPSVSITSSSNGIFTTASAHNFVPGLHVTVSNHTGASAVNGTYVVAEVPTDKTFTLDDVVTGLDVDSKGSGGSVIAELTAWQNMGFEPIHGIPYQEVVLLPAKPDNPTLGDGFYREYGILQVTLVYPLQTGVSDAETRAELITSTFPRGSSFSNNGVTVSIDETPQIMQGYPADDGYRVPVRIYYYADIFN